MRRDNHAGRPRGQRASSADYKPVWRGHSCPRPLLLLLFLSLLLLLLLPLFLLLLLLLLLPLLLRLLLPFAVAVALAVCCCCCSCRSPLPLLLPFAVAVALAVCRCRCFCRCSDPMPAPLQHRKMARFDLTSCSGKDGTSEWCPASGSVLSFAYRPSEFLSELHLCERFFPACSSFFA